MPAGRLQRRRRPGLGGRHAARRAPARARDLVHGLGAGRRAGARRGDRARQARPARARRPQPADRDGGRRPRPRRRGCLRRRVLVGRAEVHGDPAHLRRGRRCTTTFRERLLARMERGVVGDPTDPETEVGPIVNEKQLEEVLAAIERGRTTAARSSRAASGSTTRPTSSRPTLFEGVADDAFLSCEEVFGPVTSLYRFATLDEALARANAVALRALGARSSRRASRAAGASSNEIEAGIVHVNWQTAGADVHVPFGGIKGSGYGPHEQGRAASSSTPRSSPSTKTSEPLALSHGRALVTGALGCIGAWTAELVPRARRSSASTSATTAPARLIAGPTELDGLTLVRGDVTDLDALGRPRRARHHARRPPRRAPGPVLPRRPGARRAVNVVGTVNVFEAVKRRGIGADDRLRELGCRLRRRRSGERRAPTTLYGVFKLANEGTARVYWAERRRRQHRAAPVRRLRPGRDQGLTAAPTHAMGRRRAASRTRSPSAARPSSTSRPTSPARSSGRAHGAGGAAVFNLGGARDRMSDVAATIEAAVPGAEITHADNPLPVSAPSSRSRGSTHR